MQLNKITNIRLGGAGRIELVESQGEIRLLGKVLRPAEKILTLERHAVAELLGLRRYMTNRISLVEIQGHSFPLSLTTFDWIRRVASQDPTFR